MRTELLELLCCPNTGQRLSLAKVPEIEISAGITAAMSWYVSKAVRK